MTSVSTSVLVLLDPLAPSLTVVPGRAESQVEAVVAAALVGGGVVLGRETGLNLAARGYLLLWWGQVQGHCNTELVGNLQRDSWRATALMDANENPGA